MREGEVTCERGSGDMHERGSGDMFERGSGERGVGHV